MMYFVRILLIMRAEGVRLIAVKEVRNYEKIVYIIENGYLLFNGLWEMHTPHPTHRWRTSAPRPPPRFF